MQINLTGQRMDITPALRSYVNEKMARLERHFDNVSIIHVILSVEKLRHCAEANLHFSGNDLHANAVESDMYAAIDALIDKLDRQAKKQKEKITDHHRSEGGLKKVPAE